MAGTSKRHRWGVGEQFWTKDRVPYHFKTERQCIRCGMVRVTQHETVGTREEHRVEFWLDLDQIEGNGTPLCDGRIECAALACSEAA